MYSDEEFRAYLSNPKLTVAKLKNIIVTFIKNVRVSLSGKNKAELINHIVKNAQMDEGLNIYLRPQISMINAVRKPTTRQPRKDKGIPRKKMIEPVVEVPKVEAPKKKKNLIKTQYINPLQ
jgi:hypothetical protein